MDIHEYFEDCARNSALWSHEDLPFKAHIYAGHPKIAVVTGENGSGKSLLVQLLSAYCRKHHDCTHVMVSIRERTGSGLNDMAGFRRTMMFGDESEHSTGAISVKVLEPAFNTLNSRTSEGKKALLILDEPEIGLSDSYASAMGAYLAEKSSQLPELAAGLVVVTHSRSLVRAMMSTLGCKPGFVKLGTKQSLNTWLKGETPKSVSDLVGLAKKSHDNWRKVRNIIDELKKS